MQLDKAREIAQEHDVEEGAEFNFHRHTGEIAAQVTVTEIKRTGSGIRKVKTEMVVDGSVHEDTNTIRDVAGYLQNDIWTECDN
jgi:hypothetical protein